MYRIPKVFSTPYLSGPTLTRGPRGCGVYTPQPATCSCGCGIQGCTCQGSSGAVPKCVDSTHTPPDSGGCQEGFSVAVTAGGVIAGAALVADAFPGPAIPG